ncbi:MAG: hypothetical protein ACHRHE_00855 [Tepidisphaerales bacterium]
MTDTSTRPTDRFMPWAVFLGMSWTWCIGMFLPVLLVRDLGISGWLVFAIPNVLGAAAMGFILRRRTQSRRLVRTHQPMLRLFSWVTIAFHIFFIQWFVGARLGIDGAILLLAVASVPLGWVMLRFRGGELALAVIAFLTSLGVIAFVLVFGRHHTIPAIAPAAGGKAVLGSLELLPVCLLGFGLCPYLDLTFHRARQHLNYGASRPAFALGFGLFFLAMIVFSLHYAPNLAALLRGEVSVPRPWAVAIAVHLLVQSATTILFHFRALWDTQQRRPRGNWPVIVAVLVPLLLAELCGARGPAFGLDCGEIVYRVFMGSYGLIFPAYACTCMIPLSRPGRPGWARVMLFIVAVIGAMPFYFRGFVIGDFARLLPGVGVVLAATVIVRLTCVGAGPAGKS